MFGNPGCMLIQGETKKWLGKHHGLETLMHKVLAIGSWVWADELCNI